MNLLRMLEEPVDLTNKDDFIKLFTEQVWPIVEIVLWVLVAALAIVFIVKAITTALAVMKAADEPQVRQEKISAFKYLAIGLGIAIVVLSLATFITDLILDNAVSGIGGTTSGS